MRTRNGHQQLFAALLVVLTLVVAGCRGSVGETAETTGATSTTGSGAPDGTPIPDFVWNLDGDGSPTEGAVDIELIGAYEFTEEAVAFDGYTGHGVAAAGLVDTTESFTLAAWANFRSNTSFAAVVGLLGADSYAAALSIGDESQWVFATKSEDVTGVEHAILVETSPVAPGTRWTHLAGVYDKDAGVIRFYVDGELVGEATTEGPFLAEGPLTIGRGQFDGGPGNYWKGAIDNVAVYSTALTAEQVTDVFETTKPGSPPPPLPAPDPSTYADGILNGTWDYTLGPEDAQLIIENYAGFVDDADEVTIRVGFDNHEYWQGVLFDGKLILENGFPEGSAGTIFIDEDILILDESMVLSLALDGDDLTLDWLEVCVGDACSDTPLDPFDLIVFEHTFTKSSDDPSY